MPNQFIGNHSLYFYAQKATVSGTVALKATVPDTMALEKIHERFTTVSVCKKGTGTTYMLQIKNLTLTHKKDLREILSNFSCVFNNGDKAVIIGEEGNGKSTLLKWLYDPSLVEEY